MNDHKTEVTIQKTSIKMIDVNTDKVSTIDVNGKLNTTDSKHKAKAMGLTYVAKENIKDTFLVNTNDLQQLKVE